MIFDTLGVLSLRVEIVFWSLKPRGYTRGAFTILQQAKKIPATARGVGEADMKIPEIYVTLARSFWQGWGRGIVSGYIQPS
jgi:hypothetical protein